MGEEFVFPQDYGTTDEYNENEGDANDAANFGALAGATRSTSAIINGLEMSVDFDTREIIVGSGRVYIVDDNVEAATSGEKRDNVGFVATVNEHTQSNANDDLLHVGLSISSLNKNNVVPWTSSDTSENVSGDPFIKIGEVDFANETVSDQWHLVTGDGALSYPDQEAAKKAGKDLPEGTIIYNREDEVHSVVKKSNGETNVVKLGIDTRRAVNQLVIQNAKQDFRLGLSQLNFDDGQFTVFADEQKSSTYNVVTSYGDNGFAALAEENSGAVFLPSEQMDFLPQSVWITDDAEIPDGTNIQYEIVDRNGNRVTISRDEVDTHVDISDTIETFEVQTRAILVKEEDLVPRLNSFSAYYSGDVPTSYLDAEIASSKEVK